MGLWSFRSDMPSSKSNQRFKLHALDNFGHINVKIKYYMFTLAVMPDPPMPAQQGVEGVVLRLYDCEHLLTPRDFKVRRYSVRLGGVKAPLKPPLPEWLPHSLTVYVH